MKERPHLVVLRGLPASGKTTIAKTYEAKGYTILSKEKMRLVLFGNADDKIGKAKTHRVDKLYRKTVRHGMRSGENLVLDNLHLGTADMKRYRKLARVYGYNLEVVDLRDCPVSVCIKRDKERGGKVGAKYIRNLAKHHNLDILEGLRS